MTFTTRTSYPIHSRTTLTSTKDMKTACKLYGHFKFFPPLQFFRRGVHFSAAANMPIKVGDTIPSIDLFEGTPATKVNLVDLSKGKKVIVFAVPGAFTPGCSKTHLPGYVTKADELKKQGITEIVCISVNDPFVMSAWGKEHKATGKVRMLADSSAQLTKALELQQDLAPLGGVRSKRYSMVIEDGKITQLQVEPDGTGLSCSLVEAIKL